MDEYLAHGREIENKAKVPISFIQASHVVRMDGVHIL
jgi:hypothetical protein